MAQSSRPNLWNSIRAGTTVRIRRVRQWTRDLRGTPLFLGVEHVGLYPTKGASGKVIADWYRERFGFSLKEGAANFFLGDIGQGRIEILKEAITDRCHIAVQVSNFEKAVARLKVQGVALEEPLKTKPGIKAVFLKERDPSGNLVHLFWIG